MTEETKPMTPSAAALHLGVSPRHVRCLLESGELAGWRVGKLWKTELRHLEDYKKRNSNRAAPAVVSLRRDGA